MHLLASQGRDLKKQTTNRVRREQMSTNLKRRAILGAKAATTMLPKSGAASDGGDNADGVAVLGGRIFLGQVANVFVINVDVNEAAQLPFLGEKMPAQFAEFRGQAT